MGKQKPARRDSSGRRKHGRSHVKGKRSRVSRRLRRFAKRVGSTLWLPAAWARSGSSGRHKHGRSRVRRMRSRASRRLRRFAKRVGSTLWLPAGWAHSGADILIRWAVRWWGSRQAGRLLRGLPFLLVLVLAGYAAVASFLWVDAWVGQEYSRAANAAVRQGDHRAAQLYLEWMARNGQGGLETTYRLALVSQELDEPDRCELLLNKLAPADRAVYAPAHLLRAKQILAAIRGLQGDSNKFAEGLSKLTGHITRAKTRADEASVEYHLLQGKIGSLNRIAGEEPDQKKLIE